MLQPAAGPWMRRVLGLAALLLLSASAGAGTGGSGPGASREKLATGHRSGRRASQLAATLVISPLTIRNATCANANDGAVTFTVTGGFLGQYVFALSANAGLTFAPVIPGSLGSDSYRISGLLAG